MQYLKISTAQFENKSGDKEYNLRLLINYRRKQLRKDQKSLHFMNAPSPDTASQGSFRKMICWKLPNIYQKDKVSLN